MQDDEPLFKSAHAAVTFAVNYSSTDHVERSPASKAADDHKGGGGKGLIGVDGAAQAGMILSNVRAIGDLYEACIIARVAKKRLVCSCGALCCSRSKPNLLWMDAINNVAMVAKSHLENMRVDGKRGVADNPALRRAIVAKYFGEQVRIKELAKACEVSDVTVSVHIGKIHKLLKRAEHEAWELLEERLRALGVVG
jgi:hypothetical protein